MVLCVVVEEEVGVHNCTNTRNYGSSGGERNVSVF